MKKQSCRIIIFTFLLAFLSFLPIETFAQENDQERIIVTFNESINDELLNNEGIEIHHTFPNYNAAAVTVTAEVKQQLQENHNVKAIELDAIVSANAQVVDWGFTEVQAANTHQLGFTGKGIKIGIIDSGVDRKHPDLDIAGGISFVGLPNEYHDDNGHGTHVAGIIAARDNDIGIIGVAPEAELYAIKVMGNDGLGNNSDVVKGIEWAIENKLDIINLSLTTEQKSVIMELALHNAYEKGIIIVGAAGNNEKEFMKPVDVLYPARFPTVIAVGAVNKNNEKTSFSYYGKSLEFVAPGKEINSTYIKNPENNTRYETSSGTSMAAPFVSGIAALYKEAYPMLDNKKIRSLMQADTIDLGAPGKDPLFGYGLVQAPQRLIEIAFPDIEFDSWSEEAIMTLYKEGIISGYPNGYFYPNKEITRAEAITMISRALNIEGTPQSTIFKDVSQAHYASGYIALASERGIIAGYPDGNFGPNDQIIRADTAVMLVKAFNFARVTTPPFPDVNEGLYYSEAIHILKGAKIATGFPDGSYQPTKRITRAEFAVLLAKASQK